MNRKSHGFFQFGKLLDMDSKAAKRWLVDGSVQGVGYRYFVQKTALSLGVAGWAQNLADGRVEVYGVGTNGQLSDLAAALHVGPPMSAVRTVKETEEAVQSLTSFAIR